LKAVYAEFADAGAASDWLPTVTIISDSGDVIARACEQEVKVAAGGDASVSWFPRIRRRGAAVTPGPSCQLLGSGNGTTTLAITLTKAVPARGTLHVVFAQISIPDGVDGGSDPTGVVDSGGHGPWRIPSSVTASPIIGDIRQTEAGNAWSMQAGSCCRACVAADLGVGATITVTFGSVAPANFHTTGLVIYEPASFATVLQNNLWRPAEGDAYPDVSANPRELSWDIDYGAGFSQADEDAQVITAHAAYPPQSGFVPLNGTKIGEISSGTLSLASHCLTMCAQTFTDPGGTWPADADGLVGNYGLGVPRICTN
jgi:hypothetical protein